MTIHHRDVDNDWSLGKIPVCRHDFPWLKTHMLVKPQTSNAHDDLVGFEAPPPPQKKKKTLDNDI